MIIMANLKNNNIMWFVYTTEPIIINRPSYLTISVEENTFPMQLRFVCDPAISIQTMTFFLTVFSVILLIAFVFFFIFIKYKFFY